MDSEEARAPCEKAVEASMTIILCKFCLETEDVIDGQKRLKIRLGYCSRHRPKFILVTPNCPRPVGKQ